MIPDKFGFSGKKSPSICPDCQAKLGSLKVGREYDRKYKLVSPSFIVDQIYRECSCGCVVQWSWPNVFKRRHVLPLFDDRLVIAKDY